MPTNRPLWLIAAPIIFLCLWSGGYSVAKIGLLYSEPMTLLALRYACVVVIMVILFVVIRPPLPKTRAGWGHLAIVGVLIQTVYFGMTYIAFLYGVAAGTVALLMSLQPILVAVIAPGWTGETIGWKRWGGLALGLAGTAIVITARSEIESPPALGFIFAILGLMGITIATLWEKRFGLTHHPITANLIGYTAGLLGILPFMFALETQQISWTPGLFGALAYLVIGNSLISVGLLLTMIRAGEVSKVSTLFFLVPPMAALIAWVMLGEVMPPLAWVGMTAAATGVLIATRTR